MGGHVDRIVFIAHRKKFEAQEKMKRHYVECFLFLQLR